ncbi:MAG: ABC transporter substrate-binding protein [Betaproteobacteria bacterium]|nr:MAG: ABC transporter substrate-binding protein [Betaproteobacteria bacterium]
MSNWIRLVLSAAVIALALPAHAALEKTKVHIAVGGKSAFYYLPLTIAEQLGYFKDEGLDVTISDFAGGSVALRAVVGGSADVVSGAYEHTISLQGKKQFFQAFVQQGRLPQISMAISTAKAATYKSPKDLKGMKVGVSAPGSSTNNLVNQMLGKGGLKKSDVSIVGVGLGAGAIAAMKSGQIDAISNTDPVMTKLEQDGSVKMIADTRTFKGTIEVWGAPLPAGCLYAPIEFIKKNPNTVQALTNAIVRADKWLATASPQDILKTVPEAYLLGDKALYLFSYGKIKEALSLDGSISDVGAKATLKALAAFDDQIKPTDIKLDQTYTNEFVKKANAKYK